MIRSMTAFARAEADTDLGALAWELRSVNHRYLEVSLRLPEELRGLEPAVRERVGRSLGRGKVDCSLRYRPAADTNAPLQLDPEVVERVGRACAEIGVQLGQIAPLNPLELLRWPGVQRDTERDLTPLAETAGGLLDQALEELRATREREGAQIHELLTSRCATMEELVAAERARLPQVRARLRDKLGARLAELQAQVDQDRLEQELVFLAQKMDVDEELDRLEGHIAEVRRVLERPEPVGRRLDFLMQEFNREANTLGSKSADTDTTRTAVELKVLIEQMREQVQNVE
ncbi:MAG TPA: YicC/YloC family endoribonuclease [Gammaproteobacteria bacterium]|nr:YicC/YloC family endoribonuclease [Gammaproteobacteria bacterium]